MEYYKGIWYIENFDKESPLVKFIFKELGINWSRAKELVWVINIDRF